MAKSLEAWRKSVEGKHIDTDDKLVPPYVPSYDCVDVSKSWAYYLTGTFWIAPGSAGDLYNDYFGSSFTKVPAGKDPENGDIVVIGKRGGYAAYGHTGVIVGMKDGRIALLEQDTFAQKPAIVVWYDYKTLPIDGWLRPKVKFTYYADKDSEKPPKPQHKPIDKEHVKILFKQILEREPKEEEYKQFVGKKTIPQLRAGLMNSTARKKLIELKKQAAEQAKKN